MAATDLYLVITSSADGIYTKRMTRSTIEKEYLNIDPEDARFVFLTQEQFDSVSDPDYWGKFGGEDNNTVVAIIKDGRVVVPKPLEVVIKWELE
jgi:hypothetical protein